MVFRVEVFMSLICGFSFIFSNIVNILSVFRYYLSIGDFVSFPVLFVV